MKTTCSECGTIYDGLSCPICSVRQKLDEQKEQLEQQQKKISDSLKKSAEDQQFAIDQSLEKQKELLAEQKEAIEEAQLETEYALEEASERYEQTVSEAWKLQSENKEKRARELFYAGLFEEANRLSLEAISQDPGNIKAYNIASWSYFQLGQNTKSRELLEKEIRLLAIWHQNYFNYPLFVLEHIVETKDNENFLDSFLEVSEKFSTFNISLIKKLLDNYLYQAAHKLYLILIKKCFQARMEFIAYEIEIHNRLFNNSNTKKLEEYLKKFSYKEKDSVLKEYKELYDSKGALSDTTMALLKLKIKERYAEWKPDIENDFLKQAKSNSQEKEIGLKLLDFFTIIFIVLATYLILYFVQSQAMQGFGEINIEKVAAVVVMIYIFFRLTHIFMAQRGTAKSFKSMCESEQKLINDFWKQN